MKSPDSGIEILCCVSPFEDGKPNLILARTVKGSGISFIENDLKWHHKVPSDAQLSSALDELSRATAELLMGA